MKKLFKYYLMAMAAVLSISLASCTNDDELLDIDDEEEMFDPGYYDFEIVIKRFDLDGTTDNNSPAEELILTENKYSSVYYTKKSYEESVFGAIVSTADDDIRGLYHLELFVEDNVKNLKAGDVLKDFDFGLNWSGSSNLCYSSLEGHDYKMEGAIRVDKRFKNSIVLNFENFTVTDIHNTTLVQKVFTLKGRMKFEFAEDPN